MSLPHGSFILAIGTASVLAILFFLKRTSVDLSNRLFYWLTGITLALSAGMFIFLTHLDRPFQDKPRIAFIPVYKNNDPDAWINWSIFELAARMAQRRAAEQVIIYPPSKTNQMIETDSLSSLHYLVKFSRLIESDYLAYGVIGGNGNQFSLNWQLYDLNSQAEIFIEKLPVQNDEIQAVADRVSGKVIKNLQLRVSADNYHQTSSEVLKWLAAAQRGLVQSDLDSCIQSAERAFRSDSLYLPGRSLLADLYLRKGLTGEEEGKSGLQSYLIAKKLTERSITLDSTLADSYRLLGQYNVISKRWGLAEKNLLKAWSLAPYDANIYHDLAQLHPARFKKLTGLRDKEKCLRYAIFLNPASVESRLKLADNYFFQSREKDALSVIDKILAINPNQFDALMYRGKIYISQGRVMEVLDVFSKVIKLKPNSSAAFYNLGIAYFNTQQLEDAERLFQRAIQLDEKQRDAYLYLAYIYDRRGDLDNAIKYYRLRLIHRKDLNDTYASEARIRLYELTHSSQETSPGESGSVRKKTQIRNDNSQENLIRKP